MVDWRRWAPLSAGCVLLQTRREENRNPFQIRHQRLDPPRSDRASRPFHTEALVTETQIPQPEVVRDRAVRLFSYLRELSALRSPVIRDLERYERVLWFDELPHHATIHSIERTPAGADPDLWLEVRRSDEPRLPNPPASIADWVDLTLLHDSAREPQLRTEIVRRASDGSSVTSTLADHPEMSDAWERYLSAVWQPWAAKHREWMALYQWYSTCFPSTSRFRNSARPTSLSSRSGCSYGRGRTASCGATFSAG